MTFTTEEIELTTGSRAGIHDLTSQVSAFCRDKGDGLVSVFAPHATAGLAIIEVGAGTGEDLMRAVDDVLPADDRWRHAHGSPGHGRDHVLPAFISPSLTIPVTGGTPALGTWQSIVLVDTNRDNPRRHIRLSFLA